MSFHDRSAIKERQPSSPVSSSPRRERAEEEEREGVLSRLIVFTRFPEPGKSKTRLIPALGPAGAAELHRQMVEHTLQWAKELRDRLPLSIEIRYTGRPLEPFRRWLGPDLFVLRPGRGRPRSAHASFLARRLPDEGQKSSPDRNGRSRSFRRFGGGGADPAEFLGSRSGSCRRRGVLSDRAPPGDPPALSGNPLGDGRGSPQNPPNRPGGKAFLFAPAVPPGCGPAGGSARLAKAHPGFPGERGGRKTVPETRRLSPSLFPTLNEEENIIPCLEATGKAANVERIVVDGGSSDGTVAKAKSWGATVLSTARGRARQMNAGARAAKGEILLFLHADTILSARVSTTKSACF